MNIDNGHLVDMARFDDEKINSLEEAISHLKENGYEQLPDNENIQTAAKLELAGKKETYVGLKSSGTMSRWAREKRKRLAMSGKI